MNLQQLRELKKKQQQKSLGKAFLEAKGEYTPDSPTKIWTPGSGPLWIPDLDSIIAIDEKTWTVGCKCEACGETPSGVFMILQDDADGNGRPWTCAFMPDICPICGEKMRLEEKTFCDTVNHSIQMKGVKE